MLDRLRTTHQTNSNNDTPSKTEIDETAVTNGSRRGQKFVERCKLLLNLWHNYRESTCSSFN